MNRKLIDTLAEIGKPALTWTSPDGSKILVLPYGGRVLGLFAPQQEQNYFWTHPALDTPDTAMAFYRSSLWHNSGGDRTWLAPEADFFFPEFPNLTSYWQPRELDPGNYQVDAQSRTLTLTNRFACRLSRSGITVGLELKKSLMPALNPLRHLPWTHGLNYAGYALQTSLAFTSPAAETVGVGIWSLLQLPHGGELLMPTHSRVEPRILMGSVGASDLITGELLIRYKMRAPGEHKIGLEAPAAIGRVGYLYRSGAATSLVVRNFTINPSGEYVDVPWLATDEPGSAIEACNINSALGAFSELEYHAPAIGGRGGETSCEDVSQVWAYRGDEREILKVARMLISPEV